MKIPNKNRGLAPGHVLTNIPLSFHFFLPLPPFCSMEKLAKVTMKRQRSVFLLFLLLKIPQVKARTLQWKYCHTCVGPTHDNTAEHNNAIQQLPPLLTTTQIRELC